jgi:putative ABC transport system ATP-binding protein
MLLTFESVSKRYAHADGPVDALKDVSLEVGEGAFVTVTGPSGSGKSTLLLAASGLIRPSSGRIHFRGRPMEDRSDAALAAFRRAHVGFVMQNFGLIPYLTAVRNVALPLGLQGLAAVERESRAVAALEEVGLAVRRNHLPRELSAGQQQRVAIARAIVSRPALVLADEPTGNLDPGLSRDVLGLLRALNERMGITIVMVTHSPEAAAMGTHQARLEDGRLVSFRPAADRAPGAVATPLERAS